MQVRLCVQHTPSYGDFTTLLALHNDVNSIKNNDRKKLSLISANTKIAYTGNIFIYISVYSSG
jgi:hypothetical protein